MYDDDLGEPVEADARGMPAWVREELDRAKQIKPSRITDAWDLSIGHGTRSLGLLGLAKTLSRPREASTKARAGTGLLVVRTTLAVAAAAARWGRWWSAVLGTADGAVVVVPVAQGSPPEGWLDTADPGATYTDEIPLPPHSIHVIHHRPLLWFRPTP